MLPKRHRLTRSEDYARVRRHGRSKAHPLFILSAVPHAEGATRVGIVVGKKVGKKAVVRNRAKRVLREAARLHLGRIRPGHDIVLIARPDITGARFGDICATLELLLRRSGLLDDGRDEANER